MGAKYSIHKLDTLSKRVQFLAENYPDKELFVFYQGATRDAYTSRQLLELAGKFAYRLRHQYGFKRNDVIANTLPNSPERLISDLGIVLAGCSSLNSQILLADGSDFYLSAKNTRCEGVILRPEEDVAAWKLLKPFMTSKPDSTFTEISCDKIPDLRTGIFVSRNANGTRQPFLDGLRTSKDDVFVDSTIDPEDVAIIFATSGSTGYSKLIPRTHDDMIEMWEPVLALDWPDYTLYSDRSLGWIAGFPFGTYCSGNKRVLLDWFDGHGMRTGEDMWRAITKEKCSAAIILPLDFDNLLKYVTSIGGADYKITILASGGQPIKKSQVENMLTVAEQVVTIYGSTEANIIATSVLTDNKVEDFLCGKPMPGMSVRVVDSNGQDCKTRETGNILLKGRTIFKKIFNRLEDPQQIKYSPFTKDGWLDTEDVGFFDEVGNLYVIGRTKDTIIYGNVVLYPGWLEAKIITDPDILDACVVPVSDPVMYHNICACVKPVEGSGLNEEKLKLFCDKIFLSDLKHEGTPVPKFFMVLENFPKTYTGKPDKKILTKMAEDKFGFKGTSQ